MVVDELACRFTGGKTKSNVCVRITAGMQKLGHERLELEVSLRPRSASTSENSKAVFHESLSILVEQGTDSVVVEHLGTKVCEQWVAFGLGVRVGWKG